MLLGVVEPSLSDVMLARFFADDWWPWKRLYSFADALMFEEPLFAVAPEAGAELVVAVAFGCWPAPVEAKLVWDELEVCVVAPLDAPAPLVRFKLLLDALGALLSLAESKRLLWLLSDLMRSLVLPPSCHLLGADCCCAW